MPHLAFRLAVAAVALALTAPAASPARADDTPVTIRVGAGQNDTVSNLFDAVQLGYFKARKLDVQVQLMTSGAAEAAALAGGSLDIAESNVVSAAAAHLRGIPFVYVAPGAVYNGNDPTTKLVCGPSFTARSGKDLNGKNLGVIALGDLSQLGPVAWIDATGGDGTTVKYLEMPASSMPAALQRGTIDAATLPEPTLQVALASNAGHVCAKPFDAIAPTFMLNGWLTTTDWLKKNPDVARRFREAMLAAAIWANKNHKASAEILKQYSKAPPQVIDTMTRATFAERFDAALVQPIINAAAKEKFIDRSFPASELLAP